MHLLFETASSYTVHLAPVALRSRHTVPKAIFRKMTTELCALTRRLSETDDPAAQYLLHVDGFVGIIQVNPLRRTATLLCINQEPATTSAHR